MRKQLLGLLVPLMAFVLIASAADTTGKGAVTGAALQKLEVAHSQDGLQVEFKAKGALAPKVSTLDSPARIVVDFPNTVMATAQSRISVGSDGVKDVRIGMDGQNPPTTRVVVDLDASRQHELSASPDGGFILTIHGAVTRTSPDRACGKDGLRDASTETGAGGGDDPGCGGDSTAGSGCGAECFGACRLCVRRAEVLAERRQSCRACREGAGSGQPLCRQDRGRTGCDPYRMQLWARRAIQRFRFSQR